MITAVLSLVIGFLSTVSGGTEQPSTCSKKPQQFWARDVAPQEQPRVCTMPTISAAGLSVSALAQRCATAGSPVLIQGLTELPEWATAMRHFADRSALLAAFGGHEVRLSVSRFLTPGPEAASQQLSKAKLEFMRQAWAADGSAFRDSLLHQIRAGEPTPRVQLAAWMQSLQDNTAPPDAYVFHNVSGTAIAAAVAPLCAPSVIVEHRRPACFVRLCLTAAASCWWWLLLSLVCTWPTGRRCAAR